MKQYTYITIAILILIVIFPAATSAHQSHGADTSITHYLTNMVHIVPLTLIAATAIYVVTKIIADKRTH